MSKSGYFLDIERARVIDIAQKRAFFLKFTEVVVVQVIDGGEYFPALVAGKEGF